MVRYRAAVDHAVETRKRNDRRALSDKTPYEQGFIQCEYRWEDFPDVRALAFHPMIAGLAAVQRRSLPAGCRDGYSAGRLRAPAHRQQPCGETAPRGATLFGSSKSR